MSFTSIPFFVFLPLLLGAYFLASGRLRLWVLLAGSAVFYAAWDLRFIVLLGAISGVSFAIAQAMGPAGRALDEKSRDQRKRLLAAGIGLCIGALGLFKYLGFLSEGLLNLSRWMGLGVPSSFIVKLALPLGISYYTFKAISYLIDVYRGTMSPERSTLRYFVYMSFFPQIVAGPIARASDFLPQLGHDHKFDSTRFMLGVQLMLWGYLKKLAVADTLAGYVDGVFADPAMQHPATLLLGMHLYALQLYCDFSGYSDIAIGAGRIMGIETRLNFDRPYFSRNISEFWRRWHITLSSWLRDYLYIPLGGNALGTLKTLRNLVITMFLGGLWHGAGLTFACWGLLHGLYLVLQRLIGPWYRALTAVLRAPTVMADALAMFVTYNLVAFAFVLFRAESFGLFAEYAQGLFTIAALAPFGIAHKFIAVRCIALAGFVILVDALSMRPGVMRRFYDEASPSVRALLCALMLLVIALFGTFDGSSFIYFRF